MSWRVSASQAWHGTLSTRAHRLLGPETSPLWTDPDCTLAPMHHHTTALSEARGIAGLTADKPGKLWSYVTGYLKTLKSTRPYFDQVDYVKVPVFWGRLMDPAQFHHGLTSVSDKEVSQDGWARCTDVPPDLHKPFDFS